MSEASGRPSLIELGGRLSRRGGPTEAVGGSELVHKKYETILKAILERQKAQRSRALNALCVRLGIDHELPEIHIWAQVGQALAWKEPEFAKLAGRKRGGPRCKESIDVKRARFIVNFAQMARENSLATATRKMLIKICRKKGHSFFNSGEDRLLNSVSKGLWRIDYSPDLFTK